MILAFFPKAGVAIFFMNDIVQSENYFTKVPLFFAKRIYKNVYDRATPSKVLEEKGEEFYAPNCGYFFTLKLNLNGRFTKKPFRILAVLCVH